MTIVAGRNRVNRPYFFTDTEGDRVEFPAFGTGQGDLEGAQLAQFEMYVRAKQIEAIDGIAPDAFTAGQWSVAPSEGGATVTVTALPDGAGLPITGIAIRVDGEDVEIVDGETGAYPLELDAGEYDIDIAAITDAGTGDWSDVKQVEVA